MSKENKFTKRGGLYKEDCILIPLNFKPVKGFAKIDHDDKELTKKNWFICNGYAATDNNGTPLQMHRIIMRPKSGEYVDHINHDKLDNRKSNLRICSYAENNRNTKPNATNKTGYKGVSYDRQTGKFRASIKCNHKSLNLGRYTTKEKAALAYNQKARECFKEFAYLNKIEVSQ